MKRKKRFNGISYQMGVGPFVDRNPMRQVKMWDNIGGEVEGDFRQGGKNVKTKLTKENTSCVCGDEMLSIGKANGFQKNMHLLRQIHSQNKHRSGQSRIESDFH